MNNVRKNMLRVAILVSLLSTAAFSEQKEFENQNKDIQNRLSEITKSKKSDIDLKSAMEQNKKNPFKIPGMVMPKGTITETTPEERAKEVNKDKIEKEAAAIQKRSKNIPTVYTFLATYGMEPRADGNLPGEKEAYQMIKDGKVKVTGKKVTKGKTKITPYNRFKQLAR